MIKLKFLLTEYLAPNRLHIPLYFALSCSVLHHDINGCWNLQEGSSIYLLRGHLMVHRLAFSPMPLHVLTFAPNGPTVLVLLRQAHYISNHKGRDRYKALASLFSKSKSKSKSKIQIQSQTNSNDEAVSSKSHHLFPPSLPCPSCPSSARRPQRPLRPNQRRDLHRSKSLRGDLQGKIIFGAFLPR